MNDKRVLVVEPLPEMLSLICYNLSEEGYSAVPVSSDLEALERVREGFDGVVVLDVQTSRDTLQRFEAIRECAPSIPIVLIAIHIVPDFVREAIHKGAFDVLGKDDRFFERLREVLLAAFDQRVAQRAVRKHRKTVQGRRRFANVIGSSPAMLTVFRKMEQVCESNVSVILQGETGTGKEVVARAIHDHGTRRKGPFVAVNCGAIPGGLLESELFGHEKGAFTGAVGRKIGRFELAHGGTLFLDEIGELDLSLQAKLLRVLQEHELERVGGTERIAVDVRILSATHQDLASAAFRRDLYYRLAVFPIDIPSLRTRPTDVEELAHYFLQRLGGEQGVEATFEDGVMEVFRSHAFPGNVRELENAIMYALVSCEDGRITREDLPATIWGESSERLKSGQGDEGAMISAADIAALFPTLDSMPRVEDMEEWMIQRALELCGGSVTEAATRLGISRATLYRRIGRIGRKVS